MAFLGLEPKQMYEVPAADDLLFKLMNFLDELRQHSLFTIHYSLFTIHYYIFVLYYPSVIMSGGSWSMGFTPQIRPW